MYSSSLSTLNGRWRKNWTLTPSTSSTSLNSCGSVVIAVVSPVEELISPKTLSPRKYFLDSLSHIEGFTAEDEVQVVPECAPSGAPEPIPLAPTPQTLPSELLSLVFESVAETTTHYTQDDAIDDLKSFSLVCRAWSEPARRVLFGAFPQAVSDTASLIRLRRAVEASPSIATYITKVDLANLASRWEPRKMNELFRRAAGLLRETHNVAELSIMHVPLSPQVKAKFLGALAGSNKVRVLNLWLASGPLWVNGRSPRSVASQAHAAEGEADMEKVATVLANSNKLERLLISGYNHQTRTFSSPSILPLGVTPSYQLTSLQLVSTAICPQTLLFILGQSANSLKQLTISAVTGLTPAALDEAFALVGGSLTELSFSVDFEDFATDEGGVAIAQLDGSCFTHLRALRSLSISTDNVFADTVFTHLASLPHLRTLSLCFPSFTFTALWSFLAEDLLALRQLTVDPWENTTNVWTDKQRYDILDRCVCKSIGFSLNGVSSQAIEDAHFGIDLGACESVLELDWPRGKAPMGMRKWYQS